MSNSRHVPYHTEAYHLPWGFNGALAGPYRWFSGRPMNGARYTDATGFRYGTRALDPSGHANAYQLLPGYKRFLYVRLPLMLSPGAGAVALTAPEHARLLALGLSTLAVREVDRYRRTRRFRREVIEPVAAAVSGVLRRGYVKGRGHLWVSVPENFRDADSGKIVIQLPMDWAADKGDRERLSEVVRERLQLSDLTPSWAVHGQVPVVELSIPPKPPGKATFEDATGLFPDMSPDELLVGLGARSAAVTFDLAMESPHLLIGGGSGIGKSEFLAWLVAQFMRRGYGVAVLDAKFVSHMWLRRVPGVLYAAEAEELHNALMWLDGELLRRSRFVAAGGDPADLEPLVCLLEEMNGASNRLRAHWKAQGGMGMSPALTALANLSAMGREMRVHILMAGQSLTGKATGGPENRENFGGRALAGATSNQWRMLAPQIKPAPLKKGPAGRWHLVVGDTLKEFQAPFMDLKEKKIKNARARLIEWATGGRPGWDVPAALALWEAGGGGTESVRTPRSEVVTPEGVSLRTYAEEAGLELTTLTRWRERRSDFPAEVGFAANRTKLYDRDHLRAYVRGRLQEPVTLEE